MVKLTRRVIPTVSPVLINFLRNPPVGPDIQHSPECEQNNNGKETNHDCLNHFSPSEKELEFSFFGYRRETKIL